MSIKLIGNRINHHWNYFLALEDDLERLGRYIEFHRDNFKTFSIELAHLIFAASAEFEVVGNLIAEKLDPKKQKKKSYGQVIAEHFPQILHENVYLDKYGLKLDTPLERIKTKPLWWISYNNVKHDRENHFTEANLENALLSLASLFIIILYYEAFELNSSPQLLMKRLTDRLVPESKVFRFEPRYYTRIRGGLKRQTRISLDE